MEIIYNIFIVYLMILNILQNIYMGLKTRFIGTFIDTFTFVRIIRTYYVHNLYTN